MPDLANESQADGHMPQAEPMSISPGTSARTLGKKAACLALTPGKCKAALWWPSLPACDLSQYTQNRIQEMVRERFLMTLFECLDPTAPKARLCVSELYIPLS